MTNTYVNTYVNALVGLPTIDASDEVIESVDALDRKQDGAELHFHVFFVPFYSYAARELGSGVQEPLDSLAGRWCSVADRVIEFVRENRSACTLYDTEALYQLLRSENAATDANGELSALHGLNVSKTASVWEAFALIHGLHDDNISSRALYLEALAEPLVAEVEFDVNELVALQRKQETQFNEEREALRADLERKLGEQEKEAQLTLDQLFKTQELAEQQTLKLNEQQQKIDSLAEQTKANKNENDGLREQLKKLEEEKSELERKLGEQEKETQLTLEQLFKTQELAEQQIHKLNEQQQKVDSLTEQAKADKKANDTLSKQVKTLKSELETSKKELAAVIEQVEAVFLMKEQPNE